MDTLRFLIAFIPYCFVAVGGIVALGAYNDVRRRKNGDDE